MTRRKDQVALVTGGGTGIGRATALLLASKGSDVVINYRQSQAEAESTADEIQQLGRRAHVVRADVSDEDEVGAMFRAVDREFGSLDILVNNAATTKMVSYPDLDGMTSEIWDRILAVNVKGTFYCCRQAIDRMKRNPTGRIVNVSSIAGLTGMGSCIGYAASKAAVINMTRALAASFAPRGQRECGRARRGRDTLDSRLGKVYRSASSRHTDAAPRHRRGRGTGDLWPGSQSFCDRPSPTGGWRSYTWRCLRLWLRRDLASGHGREEILDRSTPSGGRSLGPLRRVGRLGQAKNTASAILSVTGDKTSTGMPYGRAPATVVRRIQWFS